MRNDKNQNRKNKKEDEKKQGFGERLTEIFELPKEIVLNFPKMTLMGNRNLIIENYKGIIEYERNKIRINTAIGILRITGEFLTIKEITSEDVMVEGEIRGLEFI